MRGCCCRCVLEAGNPLLLPLASIFLSPLARVLVLPHFRMPHDVAIVQGLNMRDADKGLCPKVIGCCAATSRRYGSRFGNVSMSTSTRSAGQRRSDGLGSWLKNSAMSVSPGSAGTVLLSRLVCLGMPFLFPCGGVSEAEEARRDQASKLRFFLEKSRKGFWQEGQRAKDKWCTISECDVSQIHRDAFVMHGALAVESGAIWLTIAWVLFMYEDSWI